MVNQNQIEHVRTLVQTTQSLSSEERQEWLSLLPFMSDKQLLELATVLESHPAVESSPAAKTVPVKSSRKALPQPPEELDLPAPKLGSAQSASSMMSPASVNARQAQQNSVSAFINRNFGATMHRGSGPVADIIPPAPPRSSTIVQSIPRPTDPVLAPSPEPPTQAVAPVLVGLPFQQGNEPVAVATA
ncbi:MAG: hypothetical protein KBD66_01340, partial [Candidatus Doudnabacteria bacterium]|nr:hypothetical protein [Candidatus Doudnabacteria bacterium]